LGKGETMETNIEAKAEVAAKYDHTTQALQEVAEQHKDKVVTPENYEEAKAVMKDVKALENAIEARRVELKAFYLEGGRAVDARAKELKGIILPVIENIKSQITAIDQKEKENKMRKERSELLPIRKAKCAELKIDKTDDELLLMPDIQFMQMIQDAQSAALAEAQRIIDQQKAEAQAAENEKKRLADLEKAKEEAAAKATRDAELAAERKVQEAERAAAAAVENARKEQEAKAQREAEEKAAAEKKIRDAGDEAMVEHWVKGLLAVPVPELAPDSLYMGVVKDLIEKIKAVI
jgi:hypothetical protein